MLIQEAGAGVLCLHLSPSTATEVHEELRRVLAGYPCDHLAQCYVVVQPGRHRIRRVRSIGA